MVFLKEAVLKGRKYYSLAQSVREPDGRIHAKVLLQLGHISDDEARMWRILLEYHAQRRATHKKPAIIYPQDIPDYWFDYTELQGESWSIEQSV